jgi:hypothetical protein
VSLDLLFPNVKASDDNADYALVTLTVNDTNMRMLPAAVAVMRYPLNSQSYHLLLRSFVEMTRQ